MAQWLSTLQAASLSVLDVQSFRFVSAPDLKEFTQVSNINAKELGASASNRFSCTNLLCCIRCDTFRCKVNNNENSRVQMTKPKSS